MNKQTFQPMQLTCKFLMKEMKMGGRKEEGSRKRPGRGTQEAVTGGKAEMPKLDRIKL